MSSNARELSGVKLTIKAGLKHFRHWVVLVETDNKVTQAYVNHLGGRSPFLNSIAWDLWSMCYQAHILFVAVHRPGKVNVLLSTHPTCHCALTQQSQCSG